MNAQATLVMLMPAVLTMKDPFDVNVMLVFLGMEFQAVQVGPCLP